MPYLALGAEQHMALSKKKSRAIAVDGEDYRWSFSPDSGFSIIVVQAAMGTGQKLEVYIHWDQYGY